MTFALGGGTNGAGVHIVERFASDGVHARQSLTGKIAAGTGAYRHWAGTVKGGGPVAENPPGHITSSDLRFVFTLSRT